MDVEKVIKGLKYLHDVENWSDEQDPSARRNITGAALALLTPRVLTLEEVVAHYSLPPVCVDDPGAQEDYSKDIQPLYFEFPHDKDDPWNVHWRGYAQVVRYLIEWRHSYNQTWRCWTARPSDEQRKAVKWE